MRRRALTLAAVSAALVVGGSEPALAITGSAGTGVAVAAQHSEIGDGLSLDAGRVVDAERRHDRQWQRQLAAAAADEDDLPVSGWVALPGLVLGIVLLLGRSAERQRLSDPA